MEFYPFIKLLEYVFVRATVAGMEGGIVTVSTAANADSPVPVRAGEASIHHKLLEPLSIKPLVIPRESIVSFPLREIPYTWHTPIS